MNLNFKLAEGITLKQYRISILKEFFRKSIHICSAFVPFFLGISKSFTIIVLCCALCFYTISEFLRIRGIEIPLVAKITQIAARKRDENKIVLGPITLCIGIILASILWNFHAATIGIFALAFGDGFASLAGRTFGRIYIPFTNGKTAAGSLTCFFAVYVSSYCVCQRPEMAFVFALVAMFVEVFPLADFDNIILPVLIGGMANYLL